MNTTLEHTFQQNNGLLRTADIRAAGCYYKDIQKLLDRNEIEQVRRGYYRIVDDNIYSDIPVLTILFPDAVLCLQSALDNYGYIDRSPSEWHVAVKSTSARTRFNVDCIKVKPHFIATNKYPVGITTTEVDGFDVKIYDRERTICDVLSHKNKLDAETFAQACQSFIKDEQRDIPTLIKYAKMLHVEKKVQEVLGAWL